MTGKPSIDRPWLKYYPEGADRVPLPQKTVYEYLYECNKDNLSCIALEYYGTKISYADFFKRIDETARAFKAQGVREGDIATIMMPNTPEAVYCFYALNKIGACANMLSPAFTPDHIAGSIDLTKSKVVAILDKFYGVFNETIYRASTERVVIVSPLTSLPLINRAASLKTQAPTIPVSDKYMSWPEFVKAGKNVEITKSGYKKDSPAIIVYSSGSTGQSKGIVLPNEAFVGLSTQREVEKSYLSRERGRMKCLAIIPMFFSTGINICINSMLCFSNTLILEPLFDGDIFVERMKEYKVSFVLTLSSHFSKLLEYDTGDMSPLKIPIAGGEALPDRLEESLNDYFAQHNSKARMMKGWGMCEYGSAATHTIESDMIRKGTGKPLSHVIISAFDLDTDEELTYNERGEIRVITPCRMLGYYKNPEATAEFFREGKDGQIWGCSGDVGYIDEEGNLFIEGRATDYILGESGGKIWLFDIENVLLADKAIQLCEAVGLVVGGGHIPVAHLVLKQDCTEPSEEVIRRINKCCIKNLSPEAVPHAYKIRDSFNVLPSGKRDTLSLKDERDGFITVDGDVLRSVSF